jgi:hypothetical protein
MKLENHLYLRAAQLHAAAAWNAREQVIENFEKDVRGVSALPFDKWRGRCETKMDIYLASYFKTDVYRAPHDREEAHAVHDPLHQWFLRFAHYLHHAFNNIGAEALGMLGNRLLPDATYLNEWEWSSEGKNKFDLRVHNGVSYSNPCATPGPDVVVSSTLSGLPPSAGVDVLTVLAVITAIGWLFLAFTRRAFLFDVRQPLADPEERVFPSLFGKGGYYLVLTAADSNSPRVSPPRDVEVIDIRNLASSKRWRERSDEAKRQPDRKLIVENFDWEIESPEVNKQRLLFIDRLMAASQNIVLVSSTDPFLFLTNDPTDSDALHWAAILRRFRRINLAAEQSWPDGDGLKRDLPELWKECHVRPELHPIAEEIRNTSSPEVLDWEAVVCEVLDRATGYYSLLWKSCTEEECFVLVSLAEGGAANPKNKVGLRQLLRKGLIVRDPQVRIMNESFRRFILTQSFDTMREVWSVRAASSGWGKARGALATGLVVTGIFLLATQQQFLQSSTGLITAAAGGVAALLKLISVLQGKSSSE